MGGTGSGGHNHSGRPLVEQARWLDASSLRRSGLLRDGWCGEVSWTDGADHRNAMEIEGGRDEIALVYAWKQGGADWVKICDRVPVLWSARRFGGEEAYFGCPACSRRVKRLYLRGMRFRCRQCHQLVYASSRERPGDRAMRKVRKLRRRMGSPEGLEQPIHRPTGMHWKTFHRRVDQILAAEDEVWDDSLRLIGRLKRSEARIKQLHARRNFW